MKSRSKKNTDFPNIYILCDVMYFKLFFAEGHLINMRLRPLFPFLSLCFTIPLLHSHRMLLLYFSVSLSYF